MRNDSFDVTIVGAGAAGLNAALVLGRARRNVLLCDDGRQRNGVAEQMHGFLSRDGFSPRDLLAMGRSDLRNYPGITVISGHVDTIDRDEEAFAIRFVNDQRVFAKRILLATGMSDELPDVPGMSACWGKSVHVCPYCHGWEMRDRKLAVYGSIRSAVGLAQELYQWSHDIVVIGPKPETLSTEDERWLDHAEVPIIVSPLERVIGRDGTIETMVLANGRSVFRSGLFLSTALRQHSDLPQCLGCRFEENGTLEVDGSNQTSVPGVYAAGDCVTHLHQVIIAAASGVKAAIAINENLLQDDIATILDGARSTEPMERGRR